MSDGCFTLPNLIIIGAQKCATTSMHYYLGLHPEICMSAEKELDFFISPQDWPKGGNWLKGIEWYRTHFQLRPGMRIYGEASPNYTNHPRFNGVPQRMHSVVPQAKLIYMVRDPIERILSNFVHRTAAGLETRSISQALHNLDDNFYIFRSRYYLQLEQYLGYFSLHNILIISRETLQNDPLAAMQATFKFLGVVDTFYSRKFKFFLHTSRFKRQRTPLGEFLHNTLDRRVFSRLPPQIREGVRKVVYWPFSYSVKRPVLSPAERYMLKSYLHDDLNRFRALTGCAFDEWSL